MTRGRRRGNIGMRDKDPPSNLQGDENLVPPAAMILMSVGAQVNEELMNILTLNLLHATFPSIQTNSTVTLCTLHF